MFYPLDEAQYGAEFITRRLVKCHAVEARLAQNICSALYRLYCEMQGNTR